MVFHKKSIEQFLIPEADIVKVAVGNKARLTLDAYDEDTIFEAIVTSIDPAASLREGIATYRTTLAFSEISDMIRIGMTTDMDIITSSREGVIVIPQRGIIYQDNKKYVRIWLPDNTVEEIEVETGISGNRG